MIKTAVVGVGYLGRFHAQKHKALAADLGFEFIGVYDSSHERSQFIANELGVKSFKSIDEVAAQADAVTVASATLAHYELSKFFLEKGRHVNVEKPIAADLKQAEHLLEIAAEKDVVFAVGHSERFSPVYAELKKKFSHPELLELRRHAPYKSRGADVSVVLDLMIHDIDIALRWNDTFKTLVHARGGKVVSETLDWAEATLEFKSGRTVTLSSSRLAMAMTRQVRGIQGRSAFRGDFQANGYDYQTWRAGSEEPIEAKETTIPKQDHLLIETQQFIKAILGKGSLEIPAVHGVEALRLALEIEKRAKES